MELTKSLTKQLSKDVKKSNGIFFTPTKTVIQTIELLHPFMTNVNKVLEPSCGSGEFLHALSNKYNKLDVTGVEYNKTIYDSVCKVYDNIINDDFIKFESSGYDLIIGNPPYFVMNTSQVDSKYYEYYDGRPNIFILFIIKSLHSLNPDGILSFILPRTFLNCLYYNNTREYIANNFKILHIIDCNDKYIDTSQETVIFIVQNTNGNNKKYIVDNENYTILGTPDNVSKLNSLYDKSTTLDKLGCTVSVGNIVWNQCKDILTDDDTKTMLIYSSYIINNQIEIQQYKNPLKKNYICKKGDTDPVLIVNRGYGVGTYKFDYSMVYGNKEYLLENHIIRIKSNDYATILKSFKNIKTKTFIKLYFGNSAINITELKHILPIYT